MKAVKLYKIQWNLEGLSEEEKTKVIETLPTEKGFTTDDNFNVAERVPVLLKKKFGYDIINFAFTEIRIVETVEDLLKLCKPNQRKEKEIFNVMSGNISSYGKQCLSNLEWNIKWRLRLESEGTSEWSMPVILDEVMLGIEKVTGMDWSGHTVDELMDPVKKQIRGISHNSKPKDIEEEMDEEEMEEED